MKHIASLFAGTLLTCLAFGGAQASPTLAASEHNVSLSGAALVADNNDDQLRQQRELQRREKTHRAEDRYQQEKMRKDQDRMIREQRRMEREQARRNTQHWDNRRHDNPHWQDKNRQALHRADKERQRRAWEREKHENWRQDHRTGHTPGRNDGKYRPEELRRGNDRQQQPASSL